jgi:hypothetical protein
VLSKDSLLPWAVKTVLGAFEVGDRVTESLLEAAKDAPNKIRDEAGTE